MFPVAPPALGYCWEPLAVNTGTLMAGMLGLGKLGRFFKNVEKTTAIQPRTPQQAWSDLEAVFGEGKVSSSTLPANPHQASLERSDVLPGDDGSRAVRVQLDDGSTKHIPYDQRGLPVFDDVAAYTTRIEKPEGWEQMTAKQRRDAEMRAATRQLRSDIEAGRVDAGMFTDEQIAAINKGGKSVPGYTWHHNAQSAPNNMQLVPRNIHRIPHSGEGSLSNGG